MLDVAELGGQADHAVEAGLGAGRRLPHAAGGVDAGVQAGDEARRRQQDRLLGPPGRVERLHPRESTARRRSWPS